MVGPRGGERKTEAHALLNPNLHHGPCALRPDTQARAQQPGPTTRMALHAGRGLDGLGPWQAGRAAPNLPGTCRGSSPTCGARAPHLQTQRLRIWQPNPQHVAARSGFADKAKCGMASLYLSTPKGQPVAFTLCTKALLHSPYSFLTFWSPGNFYDDYVF